MTTALVLDAVEHAFFTRAQEGNASLQGLIAHSDAGSTPPRSWRASPAGTTWPAP